MSGENAIAPSRRIGVEIIPFAKICGIVSGVLNNASTSLLNDFRETDDAQPKSKQHANTNEKFKDEKFKDFTIRKFED
jgi:hypothetical protein